MDLTFDNGPSVIFYFSFVACPQNRIQDDFLLFKTNFSFLTMLLPGKHSFEDNILSDNELLLSETPLGEKPRFQEIAQEIVL